MKHKQRFPGITRFALMLILFGALFPQPSAPEADQQLVAYFVTWHATGHGFGHQVEYSEDVTLKHFGETTGSAIVRFRPNESGDLMPYDTRYLSLIVVDKLEEWDLPHPGTFSCNLYDSVEITDPTENSGLYTSIDNPSLGQLLNNSSKRADGVAVFSWAPFGALETLYFTPRTVHIATPANGATGCGPGVPENTRKHPGWLPVMYPETLDDGQKFVLQAVRPKDNSHFSMNVRFSTHGRVGGHYAHVPENYTEQVEWRAEAHRLGTCPCALNSVSTMASGLAWNFSAAASPVYIPADDPAILNGRVKEVVDVWPEDHVIDANGTISDGGTARIKGTPLNVRVTTCEGIPVKGAKVQITVDPRRYSGAHNHHVVPLPRPGGRLDGIEIDKPNPDPDVFTTPYITYTTDEKGYAWDSSVNHTPPETIKFQPPVAGTSPAYYGPYEIGVAGMYIITARLEKFHDIKAWSPVTARVKLVPLEPNGPNFICCPDPVEPHPENNYGTAGTLKAFRAVANEFHDFQEGHNVLLKKCQLQPWNSGHDYPVSFNDIALRIGGIFDLDANWKIGKGHQTHNKGEGGDFNRFTEVHADETADDCWLSPQYLTPVKFPSPVRAWLITTLLEVGRWHGHWDCHDLQLDSTDCNALNEQAQFPEINLNEQGDAGFPHRLHLHVED